jgi:cell division septum initiation protein DivIVA
LTGVHVHVYYQYFVFQLGKCESEKLDLKDQVQALEERVQELTAAATAVPETDDKTGPSDRTAAKTSSVAGLFGRFKK